MKDDFDYTGNQGNACERIPAGKEYSPDYQINKDEHADEDIIDEATDFIPGCTLQQRMACQKDSLRFVRDKCENPRAYLVWIGRSVLRLKHREMAEIFRLDSSGLCRIAKKADQAIQKKK